MQRTCAPSVPAGRWELQALELDEPTGLAITNGHQNGENPGAATQFSAQVVLGPLLAQQASGRPALSVPLGTWRGVGAASTAHSTSTAVATLSFADHRNTWRAPAGAAFRHAPGPGPH